MPEKPSGFRPLKMAKVEFRGSNKNVLRQKRHPEVLRRISRESARDPSEYLRMTAGGPGFCWALNLLFVDEAHQSLHGGAAVRARLCVSVPLWLPLSRASVRR